MTFPILTQYRLPSTATSLSKFEAPVWDFREHYAIQFGRNWCTELKWADLIIRDLDLTENEWSVQLNACKLLAYRYLTDRQNLPSSIRQLIQQINALRQYVLELTGKACCFERLTVQQLSSFIENTLSHRPSDAVWVIYSIANLGRYAQEAGLIDRFQICDADILALLRSGLIARQANVSTTPIPDKEEAGRHLQRAYDIVMKDGDRLKSLLSESDVQTFLDRPLPPGDWQACMPDRPRGHHLVTAIQGAGAHLIAFLVGLRANEIAHLGAGCLDDKGSISYIHGHVFKEQTYPLATKWIVTRRTAEIVRQLSRVFEPIRKRSGEDTLLMVGKDHWAAHRLTKIATRYIERYSPKTQGQMRLALRTGRVFLLSTLARDSDIGFIVAFRQAKHRSMKSTVRYAMAGHTDALLKATSIKASEAFVRRLRPASQRGNSTRNNGVSK